jgi:hypothetical protein
MTERQWLECRDPALLLDWLGYRLTERQARLFAVACCRRLWEQFEDERLQRFVTLARRYVDGQSSRKQLLAAEIESNTILSERTLTGADALAHGQPHTVHLSPRIAASLAVSKNPAPSYLYIYDPDRPLDLERAAQAALLRDIIAWPGRSVRIHPHWLTPSVRDLAHAVAHDDDFDRLPILGDALEEAGCLDESILAHCRHRDLTHVPGCWLIRELVEAAIRT